MPLDDTNFGHPNECTKADVTPPPSVSSDVAPDRGMNRGATPIETDDATNMLIRARGFIERGWCRYMLAMDPAGHPIDPTTTNAVAWCANGALVAAGLSDCRNYAFYLDHPAVRRLEAEIGSENSGGGNIANFNNAQETVEPVLAAFDRAIAAGQL
jgi:hypothetical protein